MHKIRISLAFWSALVYEETYRPIVPWTLADTGWYRRPEMDTHAAVRTYA